MDVNVEAVGQCRGAADSSVDGLAALQNQAPVLSCHFIVGAAEVSASLDHRVVNQGEDFFKSQAVLLVANGAWDAGNKEREKLVDVGDRASADQVEADVGRSVDTDVTGGGQGTCTGDGEGGGGNGTNGSGFINSSTTGVVQIHLLAHLEVVVRQGYNNGSGAALRVSTSTCSCSINKDVVVFAVTQPDLIDIGTADRGIRQSGIDIKDLGGVTNGCWNQAGCKQLTRSNS